MSGINPQGCQVFSFKHPSVEELDHDFLWRTTQALPQRDRIGIFNRSYYEEVLIVRVHPEILRAQRLPPESCEETTIWNGRYRSIVGLENHLHRSGTRIAKFFLHMSEEEQRKRFLARIDAPEKNWKYMQAYEACLSATSAQVAPWYVVPADDKKNARLIISRIVLDTFNALNMRYPEAGAERQKELLSIRKELMGEGPRCHKASK